MELFRKLIHTTAAMTDMEKELTPRVSESISPIPMQ